MQVQSHTLDDDPFAVVVNDDDVQRAWLGTILRRLPAGVETYGSVRDALQGMEKAGPPSIVITDVYMPVIDGWQFVRLLRSPEYPVFNETPILVTSATYGGLDPDEMTADLRANSFLPLPTNPETLLARVRAILNRDVTAEPIYVLVVDDDRTVLMILRHALESHGYTVLTAESALQAEELIRSYPVDSVILDYLLPDGRGDELLVRFRSSYPKLTVLMLTADPRPELAVQWMELGATAYARKPVDGTYLLKLLERARRERALLQIETHLEEKARYVKRLLREREVLLREVHHRVKNNLSAVASLLSLRAGAASHEVARRALEDGRRDVENVQELYDILFRTGEYESVSLDQHLGAVVDRCRYQFSLPIQTEVRLIPVHVRPTVAMHIGIVVNELVTNAFKHAFVDRIGSDYRGGENNDTAGRIIVELRRDAAVDLVLEVRDDGTGIDPDGSGAFRDGFGIRMVELMVDQLHGTLAIQSGDGTNVTITLSEEALRSE